ncbi:GNAT family N-acetyltransferase [Shewanella sp. WXL01]|uniref:GNAT family N-acetyltransferase n=1 Tax=Shewanella sp. WXL01 TaxID=2709721 RepID=UPI0014384EB5|nr:GNAT family N-acetyltransferase [Shewanella sp. WXL01]NKF51229.1 GNAT family N-acetyltransferase [Shewanella sp. WXL01]
MSLTWHNLAFNQLSLDNLYDLLKLRVDVFVVEQNCPYPELDDKDRDSQTRHLFATNELGKIACYSRVLAPGMSYVQASIGRVIVAQDFRGAKLGVPLMQKSIAIALDAWPDAGIQIGAQHAIESFYQELGFVAASEMYLEDDIPHIDMIYQGDNCPGTGRSS